MHFSTAIYKTCLGRTIGLDDMAVIDQQLHQSLTWMSEHDITDVLELDFTAQHESFGTLETTELVPGGADIAITEDNKHEYVQLLCQHRLRGRVEQQLEAFKLGLGEIVPLKELQVFDEKEFEVRRSSSSPFFSPSSTTWRADLAPLSSLFSPSYTAHRLGRQRARPH